MAPTKDPSAPPKSPAPVSKREVRLAEALRDNLRRRKAAARAAALPQAAKSSED